VINAQGELQAAESLTQAARLLQSQPASLQLRYLQTATEIAAENNSTTIFPLPIDLLKPFLARADAAAVPTSPPESVTPPIATPGVLPPPEVNPILPQFRFNETKAER
jgi:hypothetical protein